MNTYLSLDMPLRKTLLCSKCGEEFHAAYKCPMLIEPLREGFYEGGGGGHSHEDGEEDQCIFININNFRAILSRASIEEISNSSGITNAS